MVGDDGIKHLSAGFVNLSKLNYLYLNLRYNKFFYYSFKNLNT